MCLKFFVTKSCGRIRYLWKLPKNMFLRGNRKIKDKLFRDIFSRDKKALLQLYNALNNSDYQNWEDLEVTVKMINVNYGRSSELMKKCTRLEEYSIFIHQIRVNTKKGMTLSKAIDEAIFYCMDKGILVDYLKQHRFRARMYGILEYGSDRHMYMERRDARLEGEISCTIEMCKEFSVSREDTLKKIMCKFNLEEETAKQKLEEYW